MPYGGHYQGYPHGYPAEPAGPELASYGRRVASYLIDLVVGILLAVLCGGAVTAALLMADYLMDPAGMRQEEMPLTVVLAILLGQAASWGTLFCYRWLPHANSGRTFGKWVMGIRLVKASTGVPMGKGASFGRELVYFSLAYLTCGIGFLIDLLWPLWDDRSQTLHDKVVNGIVIRD